MRKSIGYWLDPILLIGLLVSIAAGAGWAIVKNDDVGGFAVGLLISILTVLVDIVARIQKVENTVLKSSELSRVLSDESLGANLRKIANNYETIRKYDFDHYIRLADTRIADCITALNEIASGSVLIPAKSCNEYSGITAVEQAKHSVQAIHVGSMDFWKSNSGKKWLRANQIAVKRGIDIIRLFALTDKDVKDFVEILREQERARIRVLIVSPERIDHEYMVIDDRILIVIELDERKYYKAERIILDSAQVSGCSAKVSVG